MWAAWNQSSHTRKSNCQSGRTGTNDMNSAIGDHIINEKVKIVINLTAGLSVSARLTRMVIARLITVITNQKCVLPRHQQVWRRSHYKGQQYMNHLRTAVLDLCLIYLLHCLPGC